MGELMKRQRSSVTSALLSRYEREFFLPGDEKWIIANFQKKGQRVGFFVTPAKDVPSDPHQKK